MIAARLRATKVTPSPESAEVMAIVWGKSTSPDCQSRDRKNLIELATSGGARWSSGPARLEDG